MGKSEPTRDFMAVDSFSQLPFIRPPPQTNSPSSAIRLFGIDLPNDDDIGGSASTSPKESSTAPTAAAAATTVAVAPADPVRRFECHYCCRSFPTSQALGGHQNAHKRERQHAKRAHLQSALAAVHHHYQYRVHPAAAHAAAPAARRYYYASTAAAPPRLGLGLGSPSQPITGSPLPGLWRVPHALIHRDRTAPLVQPMFRDDGGNFSKFSAVPSPSSSTTTLTMSSRLACDAGAARVTDNVSLDLRL